MSGFGAFVGGGTGGSGSGGVPDDGSVTNAKVASGAAISLDKTANSATRMALSVAEQTKLAGVATAATANASDAQLRDRATHTGTQSADTLADGTTGKVYTATEKTKLAGVATGATANASDAQLRDRSTHTGAQPISATTGLQAALDGKVAAVTVGAKLWIGSQAAYDAIATKDATTLYAITS